MRESVQLEARSSSHQRPSDFDNRNGCRLGTGMRGHFVVHPTTDITDKMPTNVRRTNGGKMSSSCLVVMNLRLTKLVGGLSASINITPRR